MQYSGFFQEILSGKKLIVSAEGMAKYMPYIIAHQKGQILNFPDPLPKIQAGVFDGITNQIQNILDQSNRPEQFVAVVPMHGVLTRAGSWWDYGTEDIADLLKELIADESVKAIVLHTNCVGGTVQSANPVVSVMERNKREGNKPIIQAIDMTDFSMSKYIGVHCHKVIATHKMAETGSIGVMVKYRNDDKYLKELGIEYVEIYPPESKWKNLPLREAKKGNNQVWIDEELSPWAKHFQEVVRANRPNIDETVDGILEGRTFFAYDAVKNGLIDSIMPMDDILEYAYNYAERQAIANF